MAAPLATHATVLTCTDTFGDGGVAAHGDRIGAASQGSTSHMEGNGWTLHVVLDFTAGHAQLSYALGHGSFDTPNLLADSALLAPNTIDQPLTGTVTATGVLRLALNKLGSTGLDNIHSSQAPLPEPHSLVLIGLGMGLAGLLALRRRQG